MKLAIISHQSLSTLGGISTHIRQLAEAMTRLGVDVEVIVPETRFTTSTLTYPFRVTPIYLTSKLQTLKALEYSYKVYKYISENRRKFDAIHGSQWSTYVLVKYRDNIGIPIVTKFHGTTWIGTLVQIWLSKKMTYYKNLVKLPISFLYSSIEKTIAKNSMGLISVSYTHLTLPTTERV